ncbi:MAG: hypothetical protein U0797_28915 [Gemmataceae bacterium]
MIGHQWWWEYVYEKYGDDEILAADGQLLVTANERASRRANRASSGRSC